MMNTITRSLCVGAALLLALTIQVHAQTTAFTYQGVLAENGVPFTGNAEIQATLWNSLNGGIALAANSPPTVIVEVSEGRFLLPLDFGANFPGADRWLQLTVRTSIAQFTTLVPRQKLTPTPYAMSAYALSGGLPASQINGALPSANLSGTYSSSIALNNAANSFVGNGSGLSALNAAQLTAGLVPDARLAASVTRLGQSIETSEITDGTITPPDVDVPSFNNVFWRALGNNGTISGIHFIGTTDNQPLEFKVNNARVLLLRVAIDSDDPDNLPDGAPSITAGSPSNVVAPAAVGATISGGGAINYFGIAHPNTVNANFGTVGGGLGNTLQGNAIASVIAGGSSNTINADAFYSTISGGKENSIWTNSTFAVIGGGQGNRIEPDADHAVVSGGRQNQILTNAGYATLSGGYENRIEASATSSTIGGGIFNVIRSNAKDATIAGGAGNTILSDTVYAAIPGGVANTAGNYAFAAGRRAKANHSGSLVWGDATDADVASAENNQVTMRASGGYRLFTDSGASAGVTLAPNATAWSVLSDRAVKKDFAAVDSREVLEKLAAVPVQSWHYQWETADATPHLGPVAQDFKAAFYPGRDDKSITTLEFDGVALAAIQGLNQKLEAELRRRDVENTELQQQNRDLLKRLEAIEARLR